jgi:hypothetical protein
LFAQIRDHLARSGNADYTGAAKARFDRLLVLLIRFCRTRIDSLGAAFPYLRRLQHGDERPLEEALHSDLRDFLAAQGSTEVERSNVASGRADIYLPQPGRPAFRFVIEVKRILDSWTDSNIAPFLRQTTAYQQADLKIGVLAVLDLSDRQAGVPHFNQCLYVAERDVDAADRRHAVIVRIPGNKRTPSDSRDPGVEK